MREDVIVGQSFKYPEDPVVTLSFVEFCLVCRPEKNEYMVTQIVMRGCVDSMLLGNERANVAQATADWKCEHVET